MLSSVVRPDEESGIASYRRRVVAVFALLVLCLSTVAAAGTTSAGAEKPVLTIGWTFTPGSLDPAKDVATWNPIRTLTNEPLIKWASDGSLAPGLALSWRYYGTGRGPNKDFKFTLRPNARFSTGEPVTAQAVKTWLDYFFSAKGTYAGLMGPGLSIEAVGRLEVRLHLTIPNPDVPLLLSEINNWGFVSSPKAVAAPDLLTKQTFGAGPYTLLPSKTVSGSVYTYLPNKFYYDQSKVRWSKIVVRVIPTATAMLQALRTGEIDVSDGDFSTAAPAAAAGLNVLSSPLLSAGFVFADRNGLVSKPLADVRVRQALNYAVDRKTIVKGLWNDTTKPSSQFYASDSFDAKAENFYPYNPTKAKSLLAAAGYSRGFSFEALTCSCFGVWGTPLFQTIAKYLDAVGVEVKVVSTATTAEWLSKSRTKQYPVNSTALGVRPMALMWGPLLSPTALLNPFGATDPTMTKLYNQGLRAANPSQYWKAMSRRLTEQAYVLEIARTPGFFYASKKIGGFRLSVARNRPYASEWFPLAK